MSLNIDDKHNLVVRMMYTGPATSGRAIFRAGSLGLTPAQESFDHGFSLWSDDVPKPEVVRWSAESRNASLIVDESEHTGWTADTDHDAWVVVDLGSHLPVTQLEMLTMSDASAPRTVNLKAADQADGEFHTVFSFTVQASDANVAESGVWQTWTGFSGWGRYWKLEVRDNHGGASVAVREIRLSGPRDDIVPMDFPVVGDGVWRTVVLPIYTKLRGALTQIRFYPALQTDDDPATAPLLGNSFAVDWIRIAVQPTIERVTGCINKFYLQPDLANPTTTTITAQVEMVNGVLPVHYTTYTVLPDTAYPYATTYNCLRGGGETIRLEGKHLGTAGSAPSVSIGGQPCIGVRVEVAERALTCRLPSRHTGPFRDLDVSVRHGDLPDLVSSKPYLSYQVPPPRLSRPSLRNTAAHSIDVVWAPPGDIWDHLSVTGYVVQLRQIGGVKAEVREEVVGNVTTTTMLGLAADALYIASVAPLAENQTDREWMQVDLYGRRRGIPGALRGEFSLETNSTATLVADFMFSFFDANKTVNHSAADTRTGLGPTGMHGGEGHYGLVMVGSANVQNCNESIVCCDGYNESLGLGSCRGSAYTCSQVGSIDPFYVDGKSTREVPHSPVNGETDGAAKQIHRFADVSHRPVTPTAACGPALRLSGSRARQAGSVWYARQVNVREGFDTTFTFSIAEASLRCNLMDDTYTHCRARGGDGLAFVVQQQHPTALGAGGAGMGYTGIQNSLAVEFDTYYNAELLEPYENHVAVHTRGWRHPNSANHSFALASSAQIPDLANSIHTARVVYRPNLDPAVLFEGRFEATEQVTHFLTNAEFASGGMADWSTGLGQLEVYVDNMNKPVIVTPVNMGGLLDLEHGRAWVGFSGSTGLQTWQTQDILSWNFRQLREDPAYDAPVVVNGRGAFSCIDEDLCVHK